MIILLTPLLSCRPTPNAWSAFLAYAATLGWGVKPDYTDVQLIADQELCNYDPNIRTFDIERGGPIMLPGCYFLPECITAMGGDELIYSSWHHCPRGWCVTASSSSPKIITRKHEFFKDACLGSSV